MCYAHYRSVTAHHGLVLVDDGSEVTHPMEQKLIIMSEVHLTGKVLHLNRITVLLMNKHQLSYESVC